MLYNTFHPILGHLLTESRTGQNLRIDKHGKPREQVMLSWRQLVVLISTQKKKEKRKRKTEKRQVVHNLPVPNRDFVISLSLIPFSASQLQVELQLPSPSTFCFNSVHSSSCGLRFHFSTRLPLFYLWRVHVPLMIGLKLWTCAFVDS